MPRSEYFQTMGNNCRIQGFTFDLAERIINSNGKKTEDFNNFWFGYHKGTQTEFFPLPTVIP